MDSPWNELTLAFSRTSMFPFFDIAHYLVSVMALKRQPGAAALAWKNPLSSWFTAMLHCFGGGILSCVLLAEPPLRFLANNTNVLLASSICFPGIFISTCSTLGCGNEGSDQNLENSAGGTIITNFEQLVKGCWKPEADEWLKMSYPAKVTLLGSVIFTFQQTKHLEISRHNLMFLYTMFLVATKVTMMITETAVMPFACFEDTLSRMLFGWQRQFVSFEKRSETKSSFNGTGSSTSKPVVDASDKIKKKHTKKTE
ncbi:trimeric intracellular cation channel type B isoform X2 [Hippopotamus amphibius kiboko]|uniref:trimeric intracellular cation channel type B isoform X2 n=1 Tax=Hippopotamus amphibius kiboko TaxID=575201 RepID=UPI0025914F8B|nr:trimeric intracellular cation channel type B isoform X2 [Hippopotamus amphibius kiboko]